MTPVSGHSTAFLRKIQSALGRPPGACRRHFHDVFSSDHMASALLLDRIRNRTETDRKRLLDRLILEAGLLNLKVFPVSTAADAARAIAELAKACSPEWSDAKSLVAWHHPLINGLNLEKILTNQQVSVHVQGLETDGAAQFRLQAQNAMIGVTSADYCIAESASLVLKTRPGQSRMVSLLPSIHVAVLTQDLLLESLAECYALVKQDLADGNQGMTSCMTLISGPSKTADIEAVMVHGAHGPREVIIYVIAGSNES